MGNVGFWTRQRLYFTSVFCQSEPNEQKVGRKLTAESLDVIRSYDINLSDTSKVFSPFFEESAFFETWPKVASRHFFNFEDTAVAQAALE